MSQEDDVLSDCSDGPDEEYDFYLALLELVRLYYRTDGAKCPASKRLVKYVKSAPKYGTTKTLEELRSSLGTFYRRSREEVLEGIDNWIFEPDPFLLKLTKKIYLPLGNIYQRASSSQQDDLYSALLKVFAVIAPEEDRETIKGLIISKPSSSGSNSGLLGTLASSFKGGKGNPLEGIMGLLGGEGGGLASLLGEIKEKLGGLEEGDPSSLDPNKIGSLVKELMTDQSENSLINKMGQNPMVKSFTEKIRAEVDLPE